MLDIQNLQNYSSYTSYSEDSGTPIPSNIILCEDGQPLLLEDGGYILLEG